MLYGVSPEPFYIRFYMKIYQSCKYTIKKGREFLLVDNNWSFYRNNLLLRKKNFFSGFELKNLLVVF